MLHGADQAVVPAPQLPPDGHIEPRRVPRGEDAVGGLGMAEEAAERLPQQEGGHSSILGTGVNAPVYRGSHICQIPCHGSGYGRGLGEGRCGIIQVNGVHQIISYRKNK